MVHAIKSPKQDVQKPLSSLGFLIAQCMSTYSLHHVKVELVADLASNKNSQAPGVVTSSGRENHEQRHEFLGEIRLLMLYRHPRIRRHLVDR